MARDYAACNMARVYQSDGEPYGALVGPFAFGLVAIGHRSDRGTR